MNRHQKRAAAIPDEDLRRVFEISPFTRLARVHVLSTAGDALFTFGLAGTVFFAVGDLDDARWRVALTLLLTIAPFAAASPLIGPSLDRVRGGRRWMILATCLARVVLCVLLVRNLEGLAFYPLAFAMLVFGKGYQIARAALVPTTVRNDEELVEANSKLSLLSGVAVVCAAPVGGLFYHFGGPNWVVGVAACVFVFAAGFALRLAPATVAPEPVGDEERAELRGIAIRLAATAMGLLRGMVGFLAFLLAFEYKEDTFDLGIVAVLAQAGFIIGAASAPWLRRLLLEERILMGVLGVVAVASAVAALIGGVGVAAAMSLTMGAGSSVGKQAFDSIVQKDAPDANRGRSFARFETRFQLLWVVGAIIPIATAVPSRLGFGLMAALSTFAAGSYFAGLRTNSARQDAIDRDERRHDRGEADEVLARRLGFEPGLVPLHPEDQTLVEAATAGAEEDEGNAAGSAEQSRVVRDEVDHTPDNNDHSRDHHHDNGDDDDLAVEVDGLGSLEEPGPGLPDLTWRPDR